MSDPETKPQEIFKPVFNPKEVTISNGVTLQLAKPNYPINMLVARALGADSFNPMMTVYFKAITHVRAAKAPGSEEFKEFKQIKDRKDFEQVANLIGDDGLEELVTAVFEIPDSSASRDELKN